MNLVHILSVARRGLSRCHFAPAAYLCLLVNNVHTLVQNQRLPQQVTHHSLPLVSIMSANIKDLKTNFCTTSQEFSVSIMSANIKDLKTNFCTTSQEFSDVSFEELQTLLKDKSVVLMDVREPKELVEDGKIPGSINVPLADVETALKLQPDKFMAKYGAKLPSKEDSDNLIMSCRSGKRATTACNTARTLGFQDVRCYCGSFLDWVEKGGTVEKP